MRTNRRSHRALRAGVPLAARLLAASALTSGPALADEVTSPATPPAVDPSAQVAVIGSTGPTESAEPADPNAQASTPGPADSSAPTSAETAALRRLARAARERRLRAAVVSLARKQIGDRYVAGRAGPDAFDCSGLVRYVMGKVLDDWLSHYSRTQYRKVDRISLAHARPGDLVFYFGHGAHHVGIYIGGGRMVHAANPRAGVRVGSIRGPWYSRAYTGIGRLIPAT